MFVAVGHGRYLAEHIAGSRYVELPGADALHWVGDTAPMLDEIEEFITGVRGGFGRRACAHHHRVHRHRRLDGDAPPHSATTGGATCSTTTTASFATSSCGSAAAK